MLLLFMCLFVSDRYKYDTAAAHTNDADNFTVRSTCSPDAQNTVQQLVAGNARLYVEKHVGYFNCKKQ